MKEQDDQLDTQQLARKVLDEVVPDANDSAKETGEAAEESTRKSEQRDT